MEIFSTKEIRCLNANEELYLETASKFLIYSERVGDLY